MKIVISFLSTFWGKAGFVRLNKKRGSVEYFQQVFLGQNGNQII